MSFLSWCRSSTCALPKLSHHLRSSLWSLTVQSQWIGYSALNLNGHSVCSLKLTRVSQGDLASDTLLWGNSSISGFSIYLVCLLFPFCRHCRSFRSGVLVLCNFQDSQTSLWLLVNYRFVPSQRRVSKAEDLSLQHNCKMTLHLCFEILSSAFL